MIFQININEYVWESKNVNNNLNNQLMLVFN